MSVLSTIVCILTGVFGAVYLTLGILAALEKLPGNNRFGLRVPEVRKDQEIWTTAHKVAGPAWIGAGLAALAATLVLIQGNWLFYTALMVASLALLLLGSMLGSSSATRLDNYKAEQQKAQEQEAVGPTEYGEPAAQCGVDGGCGPCALDGMCESHEDKNASTPEPDLDAAFQAATKQDARK